MLIVPVHDSSEVKSEVLPILLGGDLRQSGHGF